MIIGITWLSEQRALRLQLLGHLPQRGCVERVHVVIQRHRSDHINARRSQACTTFEKGVKNALAEKPAVRSVTGGARRSPQIRLAAALLAALAIDADAPVRLAPLA